MRWNNRSNNRSRNGWNNQSRRNTNNNYDNRRNYNDEQDYDSDYGYDDNRYGNRAYNGDNRSRYDNRYRRRGIGGTLGDIGKFFEGSSRITNGFSFGRVIGFCFFILFILFLMSTILEYLGGLLMSYIFMISVISVLIISAFVIIKFGLYKRKTNVEDSDEDDLDDDEYVPVEDTSKNSKSRVNKKSVKEKETDSQDKNVVIEQAKQVEEVIEDNRVNKSEKFSSNIVNNVLGDFITNEDEKEANQKNIDTLKSRFFSE